jgi:hypothetical protein
MAEVLLGHSAYDTAGLVDRCDHRWPECAAAFEIHSRGSSPVQAVWAKGGVWRQKRKPPVAELKSA